MQLLDRKIVQATLIIVVGLIVYSNTLHVPFSFDDSTLTNSPCIKSFAYFLHPGTAKAYVWYGGFLSRYFGFLTFALNYRFNGLEVTGYHVVNLAIHLMAALLVNRLVFLTLSTPYFRKGRDHEAIDARAGFIALLAALLFVAHPIQTQAVTYVVQRFASLASMLYLLSLTNYLKGRLILDGPGKRPFAAGCWFAAALFSALLALKSKEIAYTLPLIVLLFEFLLFTREPRKRVRVLALALLPLLALVASRVSGGSLAEFLKNLDSATRLQTDMSRLDYLATQCRVILTYLRLLALPVDQRLDYDYPLYHSFLNPGVAASAAFLLCLLGTALYLLRVSRGREDDKTVLLRLVALGILWFFITLSVESSLIPIVDVIFEHRVYLPCVGVFIAASACLSLAGGANLRMPGWPEPRVMAGCLVVLLLFSGATYARNRCWGDDVAFWADNAWRSPQKARVYLNLGYTLEKHGDKEGADEAYRTAGSIAPQTDSLLNSGLLEIDKGRLDEALVQFRAALALNPNLAEGHNNIGKVYGLQMRTDDALKEFLLAVRLDPTLGEPHNNIGYVYAQKGRYAEALKEYDKCLALVPDYEVAYLNRGKALQATGHTNEALADFSRVLKLNPSNAFALQQLHLAGKER